MQFYNLESEASKMSNKDKICDLFYNKHQNQTEIATAVGVSQQYVSKIIKADSRYEIEKENRKAQHSQERKAKQAKSEKSKREQADREYEYLRYLQRCNANEMSKRYLPTNELFKWEKQLYGIRN